MKLHGGLKSDYKGYSGKVSLSMDRLAPNSDAHGERQSESAIEGLSRLNISKKSTFGSNWLRHVHNISGSSKIVPITCTTEEPKAHSITDSAQNMISGTDKRSLYSSDYCLSMALNNHIYGLLNKPHNKEEQNNNAHLVPSKSIWKLFCDKVKPNISAKIRSLGEQSDQCGDSDVDDADFTDDEIIQITSQVSGQGSSSSRSSSRLSCNKRKRTNTLSADLEVEALLESGTESVCSIDSHFSDFTEAEPVMTELPRKRHCSGLSDDLRPFLDLEKMQDKVEELTPAFCGHNRPTAIRIMCFSPIQTNASRGMKSPVQYSNRDILVASTFCPLTPIEQPTACYS